MGRIDTACFSFRYKMPVHQSKWTSLISPYTSELYILFPYYRSNCRIPCHWKVAPPKIVATWPQSWRVTQGELHMAKWLRSYVATELHCFGSWFKERDIIVFSALVSGHGLKNKIYSCLARLFRVMD